MLKWVEKNNDIRTNSLLLESTYKNDNKTSIKCSTCDLKKGFALRKIERTRLNENQKSYILEKFNIGEKDSNAKADPKACEKEMITMTNRFSNEERLSYKKIQSQFSYLTQQKKKNKKIEPQSDISSSSDTEVPKKLKKKANKVAEKINSDSDD